MSPPFVLCTAMSPKAVIAAGTANGFLWLGGGGEKSSGAQAAKKKRSRKWEGLRADDSISVKVADGPIVAMYAVSASFLMTMINIVFCRTFLDATTVLTCTLLGSIHAHSISRTPEGKLEAEKEWSTDASAVDKVNALVAVDHWLAVGGINKVGKGIVEVFKFQDTAPPPEDV